MANQESPQRTDQQQAIGISINDALEALFHLEAVVGKEHGYARQLDKAAQMVGELAHELAAKNLAHRCEGCGEWASPCTCERQAAGIEL